MLVGEALTFILVHSRLGHRSNLHVIAKPKRASCVERCHWLVHKSLLNRPHHWIEKKAYSLVVLGLSNSLFKIYGSRGLAAGKDGCIKVNALLLHQNTSCECC